MLPGIVELEAEFTTAASPMCGRCKPTSTEMRYMRNFKHPDNSHRRLCNGCHDYYSGKTTWCGEIERGAANSIAYTNRECPCQATLVKRALNRARRWSQGGSQAVSCCVLTGWSAVVEASAVDLEASYVPSQPRFPKTHSFHPPSPSPSSHPLHLMLLPDNHH